MDTKIYSANSTNNSVAIWAYPRQQFCTHAHTTEKKLVGLLGQAR